MSDNILEAVRHSVGICWILCIVYFVYFVYCIGTWGVSVSCWCTCDINRAGHFTLYAHASRPIAWHVLTIQLHSYYPELLTSVIQLVCTNLPLVVHFLITKLLYRHLKVTRYPRGSASAERSMLQYHCILTQEHMAPLLLTWFNFDPSMDK